MRFGFDLGAFVRMIDVLGGYLLTYLVYAAFFSMISLDFIAWTTHDIIAKNQVMMAL